MFYGCLKQSEFFLLHNIGHCYECVFYSAVDESGGREDPFPLSSPLYCNILLREYRRMSQDIWWPVKYRRPPKINAFGGEPIGSAANTKIMRLPLLSLCSITGEDFGKCLRTFDDPSNQWCTVGHPKWMLLGAKPMAALQTHWNLIEIMRLPLLSHCFITGEDFGECLWTFNEGHASLSPFVFESEWRFGWNLVQMWSAGLQMGFWEPHCWLL